MDDNCDDGCSSNCGSSLPRVRLAVLQHVILPYETLAAGVTGVGLLASVQAHVPPEVRLVVELLGTKVALVRLVPGVLAVVLLVLGLAGEPLSATRAFERFVARVEGLVVLGEVTRPIEYFITIEAFVQVALLLAHRQHGGGNVRTAGLEFSLDVGLLRCLRAYLLHVHVAVGDLQEVVTVNRAQIVGHVRQVVVVVVAADEVVVVLARRGVGVALHRRVHRRQHGQLVIVVLADEYRDLRVGRIDENVAVV